MRLIIHGGIHRTGTTTLQRHLAQGRAELRGQGIVYPFEAANHQRLAWDLFAGRVTPEELIVQLKSESDASCHSMILSAEDFCVHKNLNWLSRLHDEFEISAHFFLRRQDIWLMSWYNQHVKWPFDRRKSRMSADEFLETIDDYYWLDFYWLAENWAQVLGRPNVRLHVLENGGDVVEEFCRAHGIDLSKLEPSGAAENSSLPPQILEFIRHFGIHSLGANERIRFLTAIRKVCQERQFTPSNVYSPAIRNLILARYSQSNSQTAQTYFNRSDGKLFAESYVQRNEKHVSGSLPSSSELMELYVVPLVQHLITAKKER